MVQETGKIYNIVDKMYLPIADRAGHYEEEWNIGIN